MGSGQFYENEVILGAIAFRDNFDIWLRDKKILLLQQDVE